MAILKHIKRLQYIDYMIKHKATGALKVFAQKNSISIATMKEVLSEMKEMGFPIKYDRTRKTYYYEEAGEMISGLFFRYGQPMSREDLKIKDAEASRLCFSTEAIFKPCKEH